MQYNFTTNSRVVSDFFAKYKTTFDAFCELINNSIQANSKTINITVTEIGESLLNKKINYIEIADNGFGVSQSEFKKKIFEIGTDIKEGGHGVGRFAAFQIGEALTIETIAHDKNLKAHTKTTLSLDSSMIRGESIEEKKVNVEHEILDKDAPTGYTVKISGIYSHEAAKKDKHKKSHKNLFIDSISEAVFLRYPLEILEDKISFYVNNKSINKADYIVGEICTKEHIFTDLENIEHKTFLTFIRYKSASKSVRVSLRVDNSNMKTVAHSFDYHCDLPETDSWLVYVDSELFDNNRDIFRNIWISEMEPNSNHLVQSIKEFVDGFFHETFKEYFDFSKKLKTDVYYPYRRFDASSGTKSIVFNQLAFFLEKEHKLLSSENKLRKVVYPLIDKAISHGELTSIMEEILTLKDESLSKFQSLVNKAKLEEIIHFTDEVTRKSQFLDVLNNIVYEEPAKHMKERSELHKIVEKQLWLFGEQYTHCPTLFSDKNLGNNLTELRKRLFDYELSQEDENILEVEDEKIRDITDLFFFNERMLDNDRREVMIVELKRPSCRIGQKELNQVDRYLYDIEKSGKFPREVDFKLYLVSSDINDFAKSRIGIADQARPSLYTYSKVNNIEIFVLKWSDIIHANRKKLSYLGNVLKTEDVDAKELLQKEYPTLDLSGVFSSLNQPSAK
ncbi:MAG: hypothetical protein FPO08_05705 [Geobacter sp.]|nr:MAG: hypothetical protein FPO08_05705 [Geobacter sp.]